MFLQSRIIMFISYNFRYKETYVVFVFIFITDYGWLWVCGVVEGRRKLAIASALGLALVQSRREREENILNK